jgi:uncharacterized GH25 family protein
VSGIKPLVALAATFVVLFLSPVGLVTAHDYWIEPSIFRLDPGGRVLFYLRVGESFSGEPAAFSIERTTRFQIDSSSRQFDVLPLQHDPAGMARLRESGLQVVSFENTPTYLELPAERFNAYLQAEGLESILQAREEAGASNKPGKEAYSRCAKTLLWVKGGQPPAAGAGLHARPVGMTLELLPETDPYDMKAPATLTVKLIYQAQPVPGAVVMALNRNAPDEVQRVESGPDGRAEFQLQRGGVWMVKAVHMVPAAAAAPEDWRSYWASLTFELPAGL